VNEMVTLVYGVIVILMLVCIPFFINSISKTPKDEKLVQEAGESDEAFAARQETYNLQQAHRDAWVADVLSIRPTKKDTP
jgi:hypothetical protein